MQHKKQTGFTLLEILVALFIIAIIAIMIIRGLQVVIASKNGIERSASQLQQVEFSMRLIGSDMRNLINRPIKQAGGQTIPALFLHDDASNTLEFTRAGLSNPLAQPRSTLLHAAYTLQNGQLSRLTYPVLEQAVTTKPNKRVILTNVKYLQWQFVGNDGRLYTSWPANNAQGQVLPKAVQLTMTLHKKGKVTRLFVVGNQVVSNTASSKPLSP
jgi:general secretion pathway protein J